MRTRNPTATALLAVSFLLEQTSAYAQTPAPLVTPQPSPGPAVAPYVVDLSKEPAASRADVIANLRKRVKYVFVIFNENESFDHEFGTFPGVDGLYSDGQAPRDAAHTLGFTQTYRDANGQSVTVQPFRIGPEQNSTFADSVDHSHTGLAAKLHVVDGTPKMDAFAATEYAKYASKGGVNNQAMGMQFARVVMNHIDCDTIPFFWNYANRFAIFDRIFATEDTPSTPNAVAMIAGQAGESQWVKHGAAPQPVSAGNHVGKLQAVPLYNDPQPFYGSQYDSHPTDQAPSSPAENYTDGNIAANLGFASLPLTFGGGDVAAKINQDRAPATDLADIRQDIPFIASLQGKPVNWRWYQEGYDHEPTDKGAEATHEGYVSHHEGPQYFGYLANNPAFRNNLRGIGDFFDDMARGDLPVDGGVFYIRGGFTNIDGQTPPIQNPNFPGPLAQADIDAVVKTKAGNDDHPGYSDHMISESMAARAINAVAARPEIWSKSAIVITYDESDGYYDHVPPRILSYGPDGLPLARGIRIPMIVISPYARAHVVSHAEGDHNAVIETIEAIFDLPPLASLPDEKQALISGEDAQYDGPNGFKQHYLGPRDINSPETDDLLSAFDPGRLAGTRPPLPAEYATIAPETIAAMPHYAGKGCAALGMTPLDAPSPAPVPAHFNTLPSTLPKFN